MAQKESSSSSLSFILVKVNKRSKSVLASARKQATSKQDAIYKNFLLHQQINNSNKSHNYNNDEEQDKQISPNKVNYNSIVDENNNMQSSSFFPQMSKENSHNEKIFYRESSHSPGYLIHLQGIPEHNHAQDIYSVQNQIRQPKLYERSKEDLIKKLSVQQQNLKQLNDWQQQKSYHMNTPYNEELPEELHPFLQTYMKPYHQKSLSFYKQNLQHKKQLSQKSDNNRLFQIWNDEDFCLKMQTHTHANYSKHKMDSPQKKQSNQSPVFFPKSSKLRRSYTKLSSINEMGNLQKQFMGEEIYTKQANPKNGDQKQNIGEGNQSQQNRVWNQQNKSMSNQSSKEFLEIGADIQSIYNKSVKKVPLKQLSTEIPQKVQDFERNRDEKRSRSVRDTSQRQTTTASGENSALNKILDVYSQPSTSSNNFSKRRHNNIQQFQFPSNQKDHKINQQNNTSTSTPIRQNKSFSIGPKQQLGISPQYFQQPIPLEKCESNEAHTKIINQRQLHFKNLFNKLKQINSNLLSTSQSTINRHNNPSNYQQAPTYFDVTASSSEKQTFETTDDTYPLPSKVERKSFLSATKVKLFENISQEKSRNTSIEVTAYKSPSPKHKKSKKRCIVYAFDRGFTQKDSLNEDDQTQYNLDNYITEQRHKL